MRKIVNYLIAVVLLAFSVSATAQTGLGTLQGIVFDEQNAVVPNVAVTITSPAIMGERSMMTSSKGVYRFINLPPGVYTVHVEKENFRKFEQRGITIRAGKTSGLNITLTVGEFEEMITIIHDAPIIDLKSPERRLNVDGDFISRMPLSPSREWSQVWSLVPGVDFKGSYLMGDRYSLDEIKVHGSSGWSETQNMFAMDGMTLNSARGNFSSTTFSTEIIEDIEVVTSGYNASLSPGTGGYINVVTKSGGNELHGSAVFTFQPTSWNWSNVPGGDAAKIESYIPEASFGGPVMQDRIWFFTGYRYDRKNTGVSRTPEQLAVFDRLEIPRPTSNLKQYGHRFFGKVTASLTDRDKVVFTYNWDRNFFEGISHWSDADSAARRDLSGGPLYMLDYSRIWTDNFTSTVKGSYRSYQTSADPDFNNKAQIIRFEALRGGSPDYRNGYVVYNGRGYGQVDRGVQTEIRNDNNLYIQDFFGGHDVDFGFNGRPKSWVATSNLTPIEDGFYRGNEAKNADGQWVLFQVFSTELPEYVRNVQGSETWGGYIQDTWVLNDRLTLNMGIRIQRDYDNEGGKHKRGTVGGNLGFAYALTSDQKQSLRFSFSRKQKEINGTYYLHSEVYSASPGHTSKYDYDLDGIWDRIVTNPVKETTPRRYDDDPSRTFADDYGPSLLDAWLVGYTVILPLNISFDASYIYNIHRDLQDGGNDNYIWEGNQVIGQRQPQYRSTYFQFNNTWSSVHYNALELLATKAFSSGWQLIASYTWQDATLKGQWHPYEREYYLYPASWFEVSHYGNDAPHLFNLAASIILPYDLTLNVNVNARAGNYEAPRQNPFDYSVPFYVTLPDGSTAINPYRVTQWAQPRNAPRTQMNGVMNVNLGLGKQFSFGPYQISTQFQVFNIFNDGNYTQFIAPYYDENMEPEGDFRYYSIQSPRAAQLLVKMTF